MVKAKKLPEQFKKFDGYKSLDFDNKIYQVKTYRLLKKLNKVKPKILELGCADGSFTKLLGEELGGEAWGVDIAPKSIRAARELGVHAAVGDLSKKLLLKSNTFDIVVALETIEHIFDTDVFISEIHRVLKPGGVLVLSTPNLASFQNRFRLFTNKYPKYLSYRANDGHIFLYTLPILVAHLREHGLQVIEATSPNFFNPWITKRWLPKVFREMSMALGDMAPNLGSHLVISAVKS